MPFDATQNKVIEPIKQKPKSFRSNKAFMRKNKKENQGKRTVSRLLILLITRVNQTQLHHQGKLLTAQKSRLSYPMGQLSRQKISRQSKIRQFSFSNRKKMLISYILKNTRSE